MPFWDIAPIVPIPLIRYQHRRDGGIWKIWAGHLWNGRVARIFPADLQSPESVISCKSPQG